MKLTPQQLEVYQAALAGALFYRYPLDQMHSQMSADSVRSFLGIEPNSTLVKNFEFMLAHPDEFTPLVDGKLAMWDDGMVLWENVGVVPWNPSLEEP